MLPTSTPSFETKNHLSLFFSSFPLKNTQNNQVRSVCAFFSPLFPPFSLSLSLARSLSLSRSHSLPLYLLLATTPSFLPPLRPLQSHSQPPPSLPPSPPSRPCQRGDRAATRESVLMGGIQRVWKTVNHRRQRNAALDEGGTWRWCRSLPHHRLEQRPRHAGREDGRGL